MPSGRAMLQPCGKRSIATAMVLGVLASLAGCTIDPSATGRVRPGGAAGADSGAAVAFAETAFEPVRLRVHPLTHVDATDGTTSVLVLHYELRDQFTDPVKGLGALRVQARPQRVRQGEPDAADATTWDVADLTDPRTNSQRFDPATRTYRVALGAPAWVREWATSQDPQRALIVRATLTTARGDGTRRVLSDDFVLER
jgi:hypothetical protein